MHGCGTSVELCWRFRLLEADCLMGLGRPREALTLLEGAPPDGELAARQAMLQGWAAYLLSDYSRAENLLDNAHHLAEAAGAKVLVAEVELRQGLLRVANRPDEADTVLRHALEIATQAGDVYVQTLASGNLGFLFLNGLSRYDEAIYWFNRTLALAKQIGASTLAAQTVGNLGSCYYYLGDFDRALANYSKAEEQFNRIGNRRLEELWIGNTGGVLLDMEDFARSIERSQRALDLAKQVGDKVRSIEWLINLAHANLELGKPDAAENYNQQASTLAEAIGAKRQRPYIQLNSARIAEGRGRLEQAEKIYKSILASAALDPLPTLEAQGGLATLYVHAGMPGKADRQFRTTVSMIESRQSGLAKVDDRLSYLSGLVRFYRTYVDFLVKRGETARALEVVESSRARILMQHVTNSAQRPSPARSSGRVLVSYWLAPKRSYAWVISPAGIRMFELQPEKEIRGLVNAYRTVIDDIRDPLETHNTAGLALSRMLLGPIDLPAGSHVVIVPDGVLHLLNFATLPSPLDAGKYWIEDVTISIAPSLSLLPRGHASEQRQHASLLAIGDPESPGAEYPRLPHAGAELDAIAALFPAADEVVYRGHASQPSVYRNSHPERFSFIHFAAHASANRTAPLDSALILSREGKSYALTAREIADVPVDARLVSLSSCRSAGAREYEGEGLVGLAWAFLDAGAQNVVAGLWDVDDQSTARLMALMYRGVMRNIPPDDALRSAQLSLIHDARSPYHKPYYWGPFQLYIGK